MYIYIVLLSIMPFLNQFGFFDSPYACLETPSNNKSISQDGDFNNSYFRKRLIASFNPLSQEFPPLKIESKKKTECETGVIEQYNNSIFKAFVEGMFPC